MVCGNIRKHTGVETLIPGFGSRPHPVIAASTLAQTKSMLRSMPMTPRFPGPGDADRRLDHGVDQMIIQPVVPMVM